MKKIISILLATFLFVSFAFTQERELSNYEKYRMEQENIELGVQEQEVFYIVENMPTFQGEDAKEFRKWIAQNVIYPENAVKNGITGKVIVQFVVNSDGNIVNAQVPESVNEYLDKEAIRVVESSPKWKPGTQRGVAVNVQFTFPINFVLDEQVASDEATTVINNYYIEDNNNDWEWRNRVNHRLYFGNSYYRHYDPYYYGGYYGSYYPYYSYNYYNPYYYGGYYGSYYPYYGYNSYSYNRYYINNPNRGRHYGSSGALGYNKHYYSPYTKTNKSGYVNSPYMTASKKNTFIPTSRTKTSASVRPNTVNKNTVVRNNTTNKTTRVAPNSRNVKTTRVTSNGRTVSPYTRVLEDGKTNKTNRTYTPSYNKPRTATKQTYNKPQRSTNVRSSTPIKSRSNTYNRSTQSTTRSSSTYSRPSTKSSSTYSRPSSTSRSSSSYSRPSTKSSSTYSRPSSTSRSSSSYSRSSTPSRSSSTYSRPSSSGSRSYSSGSSSRSSSSRSSGSTTRSSGSSSRSSSSGRK